MWSSTDERTEITCASQCRDGMELDIAFDIKVIMRGIIENIGDLPIVQQSLWVLSAASWTVRDRAKATNLSIMEGVTRLLSRYPEDQVIVQYALGSIRAITLDSPENASRLVSSGCTDVFRAMQRYSDNKQIRIHGLHVLAQAACSKENTKDIKMSEWVQFALNTLEVFSSDTEMVQACCLVLGEVRPAAGDTLSEENQRNVAKYCLQALNDNRTNSAVAKAACKGLGSQAHTAEVKKLITEQGGFALLVSILRESVDIADKDGEDMACAALQAMIEIFSDQVELEQKVERAGVDGVVDLILLRLSRSMQNPKVAEKGFHLLKTLFILPQNQLKGGSDALDLIISGLEVHPSNFAVVLNACEALELLMETDSVQELVFFTELFNVLVTAIQTCIDPAASTASPANSRSSSSSSIRLGMPNLPPPPVMMTDTPLSEPAKYPTGLPPVPPDLITKLAPISSLHVSAVLVAACGALSAAMGSNFFERARAAGASEVICAILRKFALFSNVVEHASWTLSRLALTTLGQIQLGNLGAVRILFEALEMHKNDAAVVECIIYALSNLTFDPNNSICALSLRAIPVFTDIVSMHPTAEVIVERACVSLSNVLTMQEDLAVVRECGTIPVIIQVCCYVCCSLLKFYFVQFLFL